MTGYALAAASVYAIIGGWTADVLHRDLGLTIAWQVIMVIGVVLMAIHWFGASRCPRVRRWSSSCSRRLSCWYWASSS